MLWAPLSCTSKDIRIFEEQDFILELFLKNSIKIELFIYVKEESKKKKEFLESCHQYPKFKDIRAF